MKKNFENKVHLEGLLYDYELQKKVSGPNSKNPGTPFIYGTVTIATDESLLNTVDVTFRFVTETTKSGISQTYTLLSRMIDGFVPSVMKDGADKAAKIAVNNSTLAINDFWSNRSGDYELVSSPRSEQGFIQIVDTLSGKDEVRNLFECDVVLENVSHIDADEEANTSEKALLRGYIFDSYRKTAAPMTFTAYDPRAIAYFEGLEASKTNPVFTKIWGKQIDMTITNTITQESAFGDPSIKEVKSHRREFVITGANPEPYLWNDESTLTAEEFTKMLADRELYLATLKKDTETRNAEKANTPKTSAFATNDPPAFNNIASSEFKF